MLAFQTSIDACLSEQHRWLPFRTAHMLAFQTSIDACLSEQHKCLPFRPAQMLAFQTSTDGCLSEHQFFPRRNNLEIHWWVAVEAIRFTPALQLM
jgi:hypothetical protein